MPRVDNIPLLIAHRGYPRHYPENTLESLRAALSVGACCVEIDVQLSADGTPVLLHDATLNRTSDADGNALRLRETELRAFSVHEPARFGARHGAIRIPTLAQVVELLRTRPAATLFVEIKQESLDRFGTNDTVERILAASRPLAEQCVVISFSSEAVQLARKLGARRVGWCSETWTGAARARAEALAPDFMFVDIAAVPGGNEPLRPGSWEWAVYDITDPELALRLAARGVNYIETWAIGEMLQHPVLGRRRCSD